MVGPYLVRQTLGRGGMAEVHAAIDPRRIGAYRLVALKRLHRHLSGDHAAMFADEARIASRLRHPNVCQVTDYGAVEGRPYLVMEHLCGSTLEQARDHLAPGHGGERRIALAIAIVAEACEGLHALHELRDGDGQPLEAVHRDVAPDNVFLTCRGEVKICDFGIVKARRRRHTTTPGTVKGKLAYLAPEAIEGHELDRRADVWALGIVAWELFTGRRLFRRRSEGETLSALLEANVEPPDVVAPDVPRELGDVVLRALARDRDDRYETARAFGDALRDVASRRGMTLSHGELERWLEKATSHSSSCLERRVEADLPPVSTSSPRRSSRTLRAATVGAVLTLATTIYLAGQRAAVAESALAPTLHIALPIAEAPGSIEAQAVVERPSLPPVAPEAETPLPLEEPHPPVEEPPAGAPSACEVSPLIQPAAKPLTAVSNARKDYGF